MPRGLVSCHCKRCQRRSGTAFAVGTITEPGSVSVTQGRDQIRISAPEAGFHKQFCARCGSQLFTVDPDDGDVRGVRFGTLDDLPPCRCSATSFVAYAAPWNPLPDDGAPRFAERMRWD